MRVSSSNTCGFYFLQSLVAVQNVTFFIMVIVDLNLRLLFTESKIKIG